MTDLKTQWNRLHELLRSGDGKPLASNLGQVSSKKDLDSLFSITGIENADLEYFFTEIGGELQRKWPVFPEIGRLMPLSEVVRLMGQATPVSDCEISRRRVDANEVIPFAVWPNTWVPITQISKRAYFAFDLSPASPDGQVGQIIEVGVAEFSSVQKSAGVAYELSNLLLKEISNFEKNRYWYDQKSGRLRDINDRPRKKRRLP